MTRSLADRVAKLELFREAPRKYVVHVSDPPTAEERAAIANATGPIIVAPHACRTVEEWIAKHTPRGSLQ